VRVVLAIVIVLMIRDTCDVVETGVSRGCAIDGWLGVHGSAPVEVECVGRPPGDGPAEVWPPTRFGPEPLQRTWRSGSARRRVDWRDYELPARLLDLTDFAGTRAATPPNGLSEVCAWLHRDLEVSGRELGGVLALGSLLGDTQHRSDFRPRTIRLSCVR